MDSAEDMFSTDLRVAGRRIPWHPVWLLTVGLWLAALVLALVVGVDRTQPHGADSRTVHTCGTLLGPRNEAREERTDFGGESPVLVSEPTDAGSMCADLRADRGAEVVFLVLAGLVPLWWGLRLRDERLSARQVVLGVLVAAGAWFAVWPVSVAVPGRGGETTDVACGSPTFAAERAPACLAAKDRRLGLMGLTVLFALPVATGRGND